MIVTIGLTKIADLLVALMVAIHSLLVPITLDDLNDMTYDHLGLSDQETINKNIEDLVADFEEFQEYYAEYWLKENRDWVEEKVINGEGLDEEDLYQLQDEALDEYFEHEDGFDQFDINKDVFTKLWNNLGNDERKSINHNTSDLDESNSLTVKRWLENKIKNQRNENKNEGGNNNDN